MNHDMSTSELCDLNHKHGHHKLMPGQVLLVKPKQTHRSSSSSTTTTTTKQQARTQPRSPAPGSPRAAHSTQLTLSQQEPMKQRVYFCTTKDIKIAGVLTMSYQLLLFEPDMDDPTASRDGILKCQFCMDVRDLIGGCEISHVTTVVPSRTSKDSEKKARPVETETESSSSNRSSGGGGGGDGGGGGGGGGNSGKHEKQRDGPVPQQWTTFQVLWAENGGSGGSGSGRDGRGGRGGRGSRGGGGVGSSKTSKYYMLFMVPKDTVEDLVDTLRVYIDHHASENARRSTGQTGPNLTGGAVALLRRSISTSPEPRVGTLTVVIVVVDLWLLICGC
jgi:hypothetical protein